MATSSDSPETRPACTVAELSLILRAPSSNGILMFPQNNCDEVWPRLYVGNGAIAKNIAGLKNLRITHVLNTSQGKKFAHVDTNQDYYKASGIIFKGIPATDVANFKILPFWEETGEFIDSALSQEDMRPLGKNQHVWNKSRDSTSELSHNSS
ncbi:dual specificity protein phosphatase 3-like isoform X2 [Ptychodera flava]|uniref:dual specificity protein phosphatase 3-like isoform X2 n=1 Tax=Ptychodera flava TaxID=63121 RepID=UPI00396A1A08